MICRMASSDPIWRQVRDAVDIVEIVSEHIALRKSGKEFVGLCPFHDDRRPSMHVVPQKQIFHCFVCQTGGDVYKFVTLYHKMTNGEALRYLAQKAGITLPELPRGGGGHRDSGESSLREAVFNLNERACSYFEKNLRTETGKAGYDYLIGRGLTDETLTRFRLGMSPDSWTGLSNAAGKVGATVDLLAKAGLAKQRGDGSPYDVFRNRVMFPIQDSTGRVIAFGGRVMVERRDAEGSIIDPKYLNSPDTPVFDKSQTLYGLYQAKSHIIKTGTAVIVEGYMDVIACHQAGVQNVVATLGTALTPEHARQLRRFAQTIVLLFDSDDAGFKAADRALETFVHEPLDVKIASVPDGKDPCDFCMAHGGEPFAQLIVNATDVLAFQWDAVKRKFAANESISVRQKVAADYVRYVAAAMGGRDIDPVRRGMIVMRLSTLVGMNPQEVSDLLRQKGDNSGGTLKAAVQDSRAGHRSENAYRDRFVPSKYPSKFPPRKGIRIDGPRPSGAATAETWVLGALLSDCRLYQYVREELLLEYFSHYPTLAEKLMEYLDGSAELSECDLKDFISTVDMPELTGIACRIQSQVETLGELTSTLLQGFEFLKEQSSQKAEQTAPTEDSLMEQMKKFREQGSKVRRILPGQE